MRDPQLLARIAELEARLRELGESVGEAEGSAPVPAEEAIERHDARMWRIARDLNSARKMLREGFRLPPEEEKQ